MVVPTMRRSIVPITLGVVLFLSLASAATDVSDAPDVAQMLATPGPETTPQSYVEFSSISQIDFSTPPPFRAPATPEPGAPGPYTGPGDEAVPEGWSTWGGQGTHNQCGDLRLIFGNSDLNRDMQSDDGIVHAQGSFFAQFQAIGEGAEDITRFSFSFGKSHEEINDNELLNCNESLPDNPLGKGTAGAYIMFYRSDFEQENGFFIPIETRNVPDGDYAAAVHAYTGDSLVGYQEVARAWVMAEVINCEGSGAEMDYCNGDEYDDDPDVIANDFTKPWPWVLPGDGIQTHDVNGLTIEILEPVDFMNASINGVPVELEEWTPPPRDRDVLPLNDPGGELEGCVVEAAPACIHEVYSDGWKWEGQIEIGDVIQIEAVDRNGNEVFKSIFWDGEGGGAIDVEFPQIDFNLLSPTKQTIKAGEDLRYDMRVENTGGSQAHVDFWLSLDGGDRFERIEREHIRAAWMDMSDDHGHPTHIHLNPGDSKEIYVDIITNEQTPNGTYDVVASLTYPALGEEISRQVELEITVDGVVEPQVNETDEEPEIEDSPLFGPVVATMTVLLVALAVRHRRQRE